jgi:hypothetical protein
MLNGAFSSLRRGRKIVAENVNAQVLIGALRASLFALMVGSLFADTAYQFFPYFLIAYSVVVFRIAEPTKVPPKVMEPLALRTQS